jgi:hypothetical protein
MRQVGDIVEAATATSNVVFYSVDPRFPLIDFIYRDGKGVFHAFQATIGNDHPAHPKDIQKLEEKVGGAENLNLYYVVPGENFDSFVTRPVNPCAVRTRGTKVASASCKIWHVQVSDPNRPYKGGS